MDRRLLLITGSTAVTAGLAGCSGLLGGSDDEEPVEPEITRIGIETNGGEGQVTGSVSNPTNEAISPTVYIRIYSGGGSPEDLQTQSPEERLDQPFESIPPDEDGAVFVSIPGVYTISRLSDDVEAALVFAGEELTESDYRWYGPNANTLNADDQ